MSQLLGAAKRLIVMVEATHDHTCWFDAICELKRAIESADSETRTSNEIPAELFDGWAIYSGLGPNAGITPSDVAAVLDEVVRQIRKNRG